ncbi:MAG: fumarylacetoacetase [Granulosicoccus sp.]|nr:fumarylacetoacetase [Granulosicoccus sp.]
MELETSWIESANSASCPFPLNNLPLGVFSPSGAEARCGVAIGEFVLDVRAVEQEGLLLSNEQRICQQPSWNALMSQPREQWLALRAALKSLLDQNSKHQMQLHDHLYAIDQVNLHLPFVVSEFTDFYAGKHHASNVGTMFRGPENALPPNWLHMPIGYNGRASSVVTSGTEIIRPWGQLKSPDKPAPAYLPSRRFDFELEMGAIVGTPSNGPVTVDKANTMIFGYVLLNDWSARDIQAWEYQPLGPFQAKATATTISPWIVMADALTPFRVPTPERDIALLPHLADSDPMLFDIELSVHLSPEGKSATCISTTNYNQMYYSAAQQLAHHSSSGCPMRTGDLLGSGTISGSEKHQRGSMLELSWGGKEPLTLNSGEERSFIEDGDTITLAGQAHGNGFTIGFGECIGRVVPALENPYQGQPGCA